MRTASYELAFVIFSLLLTACDGGVKPSVGEVHTIASASSQLSTTDWPCFADKSEFDVWLANSSDIGKQTAIEDKNALWLEEGDTVKVLAVDTPSDTYQVRLESSATGDTGKTCWSLGYEGYLFSK